MYLVLVLVLFSPTERLVREVEDKIQATLNRYNDCGVVGREPGAPGETVLAVTLECVSAGVVYEEIDYLLREEMRIPASRFLLKKPETPTKWHFNPYRCVPE